MTDLHRRALARLAMTPEQVATIYAEYTRARSSGADRLPIFHVIRELCESHERLRMELQGAEELLDGGRQSE